MPQPPSKQSDNPSTPEINDPTTENIPQNEPILVILQTANTTYALILTPITQKYTDINV